MIKQTAKEKKCCGLFGECGFWERGGVRSNIELRDLFRPKTDDFAPCHNPSPNINDIVNFSFRLIPITNILNLKKNQ